MKNESESYNAGESAGAFVDHQRSEPTYVCLCFPRPNGVTKPLYVHRALDCKAGVYHE